MNDLDRRQFLMQSGGMIALASLLPQLSMAASALAAPVKVGIIGCGRQGRALQGELATFSDVTIAALADEDERSLASLVRRSPGAKGFASYKDLLSAGGLDAVLIATPTHLHRAPAIDALAAGLHVYCEAPLAHTIDDSRAIATAAKSAKGKFQTGYHGRANPVYQLARKFLKSDAVRQVVSMQAGRAEKTSMRVPSTDAAREKSLNWFLDKSVSTGLAGEWGSHQFDVFNWYREKYPVSVRGSGGIYHWNDGRDVHDTIECTLVYDDGTRLSYDATLANSYQGTWELFRGVNAAIRLAWSHAWMFKEADAPTQGWEVYANRQQLHKDEGITLIAGATQLAEQGKLKDGVGLPHSPAWYGLESFLKAITGDWEIPCSAEDGHRSTVVGIKANEAVLSGQTVAIAPELLVV